VFINKKTEADDKPVGNASTMIQAHTDRQTTRKLNASDPIYWIGGRIIVDNK